MALDGRVSWDEFIASLEFTDKERIVSLFQWTISFSSLIESASCDISNHWLSIGCVQHRISACLTPFISVSYRWVNDEWPLWTHIILGNLVTALACSFFTLSNVCSIRKRIKDNTLVFNAGGSEFAFRSWNTGLDYKWNWNTWFLFATLAHSEFPPLNALQ